MKSLQEQAQEIFVIHPQLQVIYMTQDGVAYENENNAYQRAKELNSEVVRFERKAVEQRQSRGSEYVSINQVDENPPLFNDELNEGDVQKKKR